ncbi:MAG TPA: mercuric reductase [Candidatus Sulfotelmatobacter sp.]|jgi:pyruvate/2-oxoglutarate dehydrogenase complex dihydrolipoamide dehydrogenase (E3) component|nr:mercuric reductase [Candidatus Sulfotelmatobacter sp.]
MPNPKSSQTAHYDAIVIGSGQAGTPLSQALASAGMRTALVERVHVGGTCINEGCTPTKTMVASGRVAYLARRGADYGVQVGSLHVDMLRVRKRKRDIVDLFRNGSQKRIEQARNLDLIFGAAEFTTPNSILVRDKKRQERVLTADRFFINAGCRPSVPQIVGLKDVPFLDSTSIMELNAVPEHLLVLGGGYIGLEFGQLFRRFGSRVTIIQSGSSLLSGEDADIASAVAQILKEDGIQILVSSRAEKVARHGSHIHLKIRSGGKMHSLEGSHLLVAAGRIPNIDTLKVSAAGIDTDARGFIQVNEKLETSAKNIYALGDINGGPAFTHISYDDFRIIRKNLLEKGNVSTAGRLVPYTLFIDPQLGRVGLSETEARLQNRAIRVAKMPMNYVARALEVDESRGFMKAVVDAKSGQILGAAVLGIEGGEIISQIQIAIMGKLPYTSLQNAVFAHPTLSESLNNLFNHFLT